MTRLTLLTRVIQVTDFLSGFGEQDHDVGELFGGDAVRGDGSRQAAAAVTVGGGGSGGGATLLRNDLLSVGKCGSSSVQFFAGGGRPAFVFNSGE